MGIVLDFGAQSYKKSLSIQRKFITFAVDFGKVNKCWFFLAMANGCCHLSEPLRLKGKQVKNLRCPAAVSLY